MVSNIRLTRLGEDLADQIGSKAETEKGRQGRFKHRQEGPMLVGDVRVKEPLDDNDPIDIRQENLSIFQD